MSNHVEKLLASLEKAPFNADERQALLDGLTQAWCQKPKPVAVKSASAGNTRWKPQHDAALKAMLEAGASLKQIASALGRTRQAIINRQAVIAPEHRDPMRVLQGQISGLHRAERRTNGHA